VILVFLGLIGVASVTVLLSAILVALTFLVFHTAVQDGRAGLGAFNERLPGVRDLRIYGPTAAKCGFRRTCPAYAAPLPYAKDKGRGMQCWPRGRPRTPGIKMAPPML